MDYLPEWKIYLWKKLLLDKRSIDDAPKINDFIFFDDEDQYAIPLRLAQNEIDRIEVIKQGNGTFTDIGEGTAIDDSYYSFGPKKILSALLELVNDKAKILEIFLYTKRMHLSLLITAMQLLPNFKMLKMKLLIRSKSSLVLSSNLNLILFR